MTKILKYPYYISLQNFYYFIKFNSTIPFFEYKVRLLIIVYDKKLKC